MAMMMSGSRRARGSNSIHGGWLPAVALVGGPGGGLDHFGDPIAGGHQGLNPFQASDGWFAFDERDFFDDVDDAIFQSAQHFTAVFGDIEGVGDAADVLPNFGDASGSEGDDL